MHKLIGAAAALGASVAGASAAHAEITANIALTSDYVFRGLSLSDGDPAVQGGFDWKGTAFYAGTWASSIPDGTEIDLYGGFTPTTGPVEWDIGLTGYFYPGADDDAHEFDYIEYHVSGAVPLTDRFTLGAGIFYAPDNWGDTEQATYYEINAEYAPMDALLFSAALGNQEIENPDSVPGGAGRDDYTTWNIGGTYSFQGFSLDLRYHDTDIDAGSDIEAYTYGPSSYDGAVVVTVGREL